LRKDGAAELLQPLSRATRVTLVGVVVVTEKIKIISELNKKKEREETLMSSFFDKAMARYRW